MKRYPLFLLLFIFLLLGCSNPFRATNKAYRKQARLFAKELKKFPLKDSTDLFVGTTNFSMRAPNFVIIHHTAQNSCEQTLKTFTMPATKVSSHYVVCKSGTVYHMLNDLLRGHHAGVSKWGSLTDLNSTSIGIEIDNNGTEPFFEEQISSLMVLLGRLKSSYKIPTGNFLGHADIAPGRKTDPSRYFPWEQLASEGFGHWYDTTGVQVGEGFDPLLAMKAIGYNTSNPQTAIQSYRLHFTPQDTSRVLNESDNKILTSLLEKYK